MLVFYYYIGKKKQHILASLRKAERNIFVPSGLATGVFEELPFDGILIKDCARLIGRAVVNCKNGETGVCLRKNRIKAFAKIRSDVVYRNDDCYLGLGISICLSGGGAHFTSLVNQ